MEQRSPGIVSNMGKMAKATTLLFLMAIILTEGARDMPLKDQVYSPQGLLGLWGLPLFGLPLPFLKPTPWLGHGGPCCGGLFPFLGTPKAGTPLKNFTKADVNGNAIDASP
ncbi:hypothetical protein V6Z11_A07G183700 [Gossypium hirsutum]|uniref:Uncharacterized protein n=2 Tax=Gossypium TaxID=3633 RepID=A0ABR0PDB4_GOSAR|nr:hypothetical protein PVK06_024268 [Gossypium arboreum]